MFEDGRDEHKLELWRERHERVQRALSYEPVDTVPFAFTGSAFAAISQGAPLSRFCTDADTAIEVKMPCRSNGWPSLNRDQRNASMSPVMGFRSRRFLQVGTTPVLKPIGETNTPIWTMNGTMYLKSRYLTVRAVNHRPAPNASVRAKKMKMGSSAQCQDGILPYQIEQQKYRKRTTTKSTRATPSDESGMIILGSRPSR